MNLKTVPLSEIPQLIYQLTKQMHRHAADLEFEEAAEIRDYVQILEDKSVRTKK